MKNTIGYLSKKFTIALFALLFCYTLLFFAWRIYTKSSFKAHELEQCRLLAVSATETIVSKMENEPNLWSRFNSDKTVLTINHKTFPGNWLIKVEVNNLESYIVIETTVSSGWNSRSPQKISYIARVFKKKNGFNTVYDDKEAEAIAKELSFAKTGDNITSVFFSPLNGEEKHSFTIKADLIEYKEKSFFIIRLAN